MQISHKTVFSHWVIFSELTPFVLKYITRVSFMILLAPALYLSLLFTYKIQMAPISFWRKMEEGIRGGPRVSLL